MNAYAESVDKDAEMNERINTAYRIARTAHDRLNEFGGFSFSVGLEGFGGTPTAGYMVALRRAEYVTRTCTVKTIAEYILSHWDTVEGCSDLYIGGWQDHDAVYLDVSEWFETVYEARLVGALRGQKAIFNLSNGESIYL